MREEEAIVLVISLIILAGAGLMITAMAGRRRTRELLHRERLAMIERGLIPSPETDPLRFEAAMAARSTADAGMRFRTAGVLMIGLGLGLMMLLSFTAGEPGIGIGVGGGFAMVGAASLLNYFLISKREEERAATRWVAQPTRPSDPPPSSPL